jgi:Uma2 family endonuclease
MATAILDSEPKSLADVLHELGDVPLERIRVPVGTATEQDLIDALEAADKRLYELIDGVLVEKTMGMRESVIALKCGHYICLYLDVHDRGIAFTADGPIRIRPGRIRMPDVGFVAWGRIPEDWLDHAILDAIPNLAVEIISKSNTPKEMDRKLEDYFNAGVELVWFIYPKTQTALVYTSPTTKKEIAKTGTLDGGKVLPGFKLPLKNLFAGGRRTANGRNGAQRRTR